jgi:hypothetical protein
VAVIAVEKTTNKKLGKGVMATYASQATCPTSCPLFRNGCYAEAQYLTNIRRVNASGEGMDPLAIAMREAELIRALPNHKPLRIHVIGDAPTPECANALADAVDDWGGTAWTYTHAWRDVPRVHWGNIEVWASIENIRHAVWAETMGYTRFALIVPKHESRSARREGGRLHIPCPAQTTQGVTCSSCKLCFSKKIAERKEQVVIEFAAHGYARNKVRDLVKGEAR